MRHPFTKKLFFIGACLALAGTLVSFARDEPKLTKNGLLTMSTRAVVSGENAYVLGPSETIVDVERVDKIIPAPDDSAVLIAAYKSRPYFGIALSKAEVDAGMVQRFPELNLIYWDPRTRVAKTLLRESNTPDMTAGVWDIQWMPRTRTALIVLGRFYESTQTVATTLMHVDPAAGTVRRIADLEGRFRAKVSPNQPLAYIERIPPRGENGALTGPVSLQVYTPQGLGRTINIDQEIYGLNWTLDGNSVYATRIFELNPEGKRVVRNVLTLVNLQTGEVSHPEKLPTVQNAESLGSHRLEWAVGAVTTKVTVPGPGGDPQETTALWLHPGVSSGIVSSGSKATITPSKKATPKSAVVPAPAAVVPSRGSFFTNSLLVATNAEPAGFLASTNSAALLFLRDGALCAAPIFRLPRAAYEEKIRTLQRQAAMTNAKQIVLGILMYAQDWDDNYPASGKGVEKAIEPYTKNKQIFENPATGEPSFVYTHTGSTAAADMTSPATSQLGYLSGPGGRAILWADGHITWQDGPATP